MIAGRANQAYGISFTEPGAGKREIRHPSDEGWGDEKNHDPLFKRPPQLSAKEVVLLCNLNCENGKYSFHREEEEE